MKWLKTGVRTGLLALSTLLGSHLASAQDTEKTANENQPRAESSDLTLSLPFANPVTDARANTQAYRTASNLMGYGAEYLSKSTGLDSNAIGRTAESLARCGLESLASITSHEFGHVRELKKNKVKDIHIKIKPFKYGIFSTGEVYSNRMNLTNEQKAEFFAAGLNQQTLNANNIIEERKDRANLTDDIGFLNNKLNWVTRGLMSGSDKDKDIEDTSNYCEALGMNKKRLKTKITAATLADPEVGNSLYNIADFVISGNRAHKKPSLKLSEGWNVHLPRLATYLTKKGLIGEVTGRTKIGDVTLDASFAKYLQKADNAKNANSRIGARAYIPAGPLEISPYIYGGNHSIATGAGLSAEVADGVKIRAEGGFHRKDDIQQIITGKDEGFSGIVSLEIKL